jgi:hypothetical protein
MKEMMILGLSIIAILAIAVSCGDPGAQPKNTESFSETDLGMIKSVQVIYTSTVTSPIKSIVITEKMVVTVCSPTIPLNVHAYLRHRGDSNYFFAEGMREESYVID